MCNETLLIGTDWLITTRSARALLTVVRPGMPRKHGERLTKVLARTRPCVSRRLKCNNQHKALNNGAKSSMKNKHNQSVFQPEGENALENESPLEITS